MDVLYNKLCDLLYDLLFVACNLLWTFCGLAVRQVVQLVARLAACSTTCCGLAVGFRSVVQHAVQRAVRQIHNKSKLMDSDTQTACVHLIDDNAL